MAAPSLALLSQKDLLYGVSFPSHDLYFGLRFWFGSSNPVLTGALAVVFRAAGSARANVARDANNVIVLEFIFILYSFVSNPVPFIFLCSVLLRERVEAVWSYVHPVFRLLNLSLTLFP
jgi:hypothetical protein